MKRNEALLTRAKSMRTHQTAPEQALWKLLRAHRLSGTKFTRQVPIGPYILDFAARAIKLAVELDGIHMLLKSRMTPPEPLIFRHRATA